MEQSDVFSTIEAPAPRPGSILWLAFGVSAASYPLLLASYFLFHGGKHFNAEAAMGALFMGPALGISAILQYGALVLLKPFSARLVVIFHSLIVCVVMGIFLMYVFEPWWKNNPYSSLGPPAFWLAFTSVCLAVTCASAILAGLYFHWEQRLNAHDRTLRYCPQCRYDLRGSLWAKSEQCPECGTKIPIAWRWNQRQPLGDPPNEMLPHSAELRE